jgi:hypothetical protein
MNWYLPKHVHAAVSPTLILSTNSQPNIRIRPVAWKIFLNVVGTLGANTVYVLWCVAHDLPSVWSPPVCDRVVNEEIR